MRIVPFFNHKGGVGKTTLVFNIGIALAEEGHRVLFADLDAQGNLTSAAIEQDAIEKLLRNEETIYRCLRPVIDGSGPFEPAPIERIRPNVWVIPGDIRLSEFEEILPEGWTEALAGRPRGFQVTTTMSRLLRQAGESVEADYILVDLGPNVGSLNRSAMLAADGFVIPLAPDLFSITALPSVGKSTAAWALDWDAACATLQRNGATLNYELPVGRPSPLGYISQQFAVYRQEPTAAYRRWVDQIPNAYSEGVVEAVERAGIAVAPFEPKLGEVKNLSSLIPMAQKANQAVFELSGAEARGAQWTRARDTYSLFRRLGNDIVRRLDWLAEHRNDRT